MDPQGVAERMLLMFSMRPFRTSRSLESDFGTHRKRVQRCSPS
jgi:hypothetical protein